MVDPYSGRIAARGVNPFRAHKPTYQAVQNTIRKAVSGTKNTATAARDTFTPWQTIKALPHQLRYGAPLYAQQARDAAMRAAPYATAAGAAARAYAAPAAAAAGKFVALPAAAAATGYGVGTGIDRFVGPRVTPTGQRLSHWWGDQLGDFISRRSGHRPE